ncbi:MAG: hypothetical protein LBU28_08680 [Spirochaetaceae bacterium]|nr:hypothetical protein [Spirochaetaceae bacterium]
MVKYINFEDNIFLITIRIRMLRDLLILDADPDLFLAATLQDADFIDQTLENLLDSLVENHRLIDRDEQLHNLDEAECQFETVLSEMADGQGSISAEKFPVIREKVLLLREQSLARRKTVETSQDDPDKILEGPVVTSDEMNELLKNTE